MSRVSRVLIIDPEKREVRLDHIDVAAEGALRNIIGGWIEIAVTTEAGDVLYVDEEGFRKPSLHFFRLGDHQLLVGIGVLVGPELLDDEGEWIGNADVSMTRAELAATVTWYDRANVEAWGKANASEPHTVIGQVMPDGTVRREVITTWGQAIERMPKPE